MKYSVCLDALFFDLKYFGASPENFLKGMKLAKEAGFDAVEFWGWEKKDIPSIVRAKGELGLNIAAIATKFISLCDASVRKGYLDGLRETIPVAEKLRCKTIISPAGKAMEGVSRDDQHRSIVAGLKEAAKLLEAANVTLVLEPLNTLVNHPDQFLSTSREGFEILDEVGSPNVKLLYDIYHQQIMEGNLIATITKHIKQVGHLHAAANPGRNEITGGEISYREVLRAVAEAGYGGYCGLEYMPKKDIAMGLKEALELMNEAVPIA